jgi:hypothetical protein
VGQAWQQRKQSYQTSHSHSLADAARGLELFTVRWAGGLIGPRTALLQALRLRSLLRQGLRIRTAVAKSAEQSQLSFTNTTVREGARVRVACPPPRLLKEAVTPEVSRSACTQATGTARTSTEICVVCDSDSGPAATARLGQHRWAPEPDRRQDLPLSRSRARLCPVS